MLRQSFPLRFAMNLLPPELSDVIVTYAQVNDAAILGAVSSELRAIAHGDTTWTRFLSSDFGKLPAHVLARKLTFPIMEVYNDGHPDFFQKRWTIGTAPPRPLFAPPGATVGGGTIKEGYDSGISPAEAAEVAVKSNASESKGGGLCCGQDDVGWSAARAAGDVVVTEGGGMADAISAAEAAIMIPYRRGGRGMTNHWSSAEEATGSARQRAERLYSPYSLRTFPESRPFELYAKLHETVCSSEGCDAKMSAAPGGYQCPLCLLAVCGNCYCGGACETCGDEDMGTRKVACSACNKAVCSDCHEYEELSTCVICDQIYCSDCAPICHVGSPGLYLQRATCNPGCGGISCCKACFSKPYEVSDPFEYRNHSAELVQFSQCFVHCETCDKYVCTPCCVDDDGIDVCFSYPCCGNDVGECAWPPNCGPVPYTENGHPNYANRDPP